MPYIHMCIEVVGIIIKCGNNAVCTKRLTDWVSMITPFDWKPTGAGRLGQGIRRLRDECMKREN